MAKKKKNGDGTLNELVWEISRREFNKRLEHKLWDTMGDLNTLYAAYEKIEKLTKDYNRDIKEYRLKFYEDYRGDLVYVKHEKRYKNGNPPRKRNK